MPTFEPLMTEYDHLWSTAKVRPERAAAVDAIARKLIGHKAQYQAVARATRVPWCVIAALHNRESDADFSTYLGNGDPLNRPTRNVPAGRGPFASWEDGAIDALRLDGLDQVAHWTPARVCYEIEKFNGFGYRNHHSDVLSPYLWSFTNHYEIGKYSGDGRYEAGLVDKQCGAIPIVKRIMELERIVLDGDTAVAPQGKGWLAIIVDAFMAWLRARSAPAQPPDLASRLIAAMRKRNYKLFTGPGETNIIYVKGMEPDGTKNDDAPDIFNDSRFVVIFENGKPRIAGAWEGTVDPGRYWTENRMNPGGAARVKPGQYAAWQLGDHHGHEAWIQTGGKVTVCRDDNEDFSPVGDEEDTGFFGINQHAGYDLPKNTLGRSSAGCLVGRSMAGHREFMTITKSDPRFKADKRFTVTATLLTASEV